MSDVDASQPTGSARRWRLTLVAGALLLAVLAVVAVFAVRDGIDTTRALTSPLFRNDAEAFTDRYRCLERAVADAVDGAPAVELDTREVDDDLTRYLLAMAAIGTVEIDAGPGAPVLVARSDPAAPCSLALSITRNG